ncbi:UTRA domain-containing protein [Streptomyces sp. SP18ES09]|uniref:UTRA domain-containing protein n=1 Tax=Streptomyces sp. SP18ES09 TaxID=3002532 RepID=UPI002E77E812|nr:UTRA domain-containing protein [Streptomyces sp. SP18ES09]MEE1813603.1 UTRA domain-containing protein [Streptomyces sp. SP18ES09]
MAEALQHRLAAQLLQRIHDGTYPPGSTFPSYRAIAAEHAAGLGAAYRAVQILRAAGHLEGQPRGRLTVRDAPGMRTLADPDAEWPHGRGETERSRPRADATLALRLHCEPRTQVACERVELLDPDGRPAMLVTSWWRGRRRPHESYRISVSMHRMTASEAHLLGLATGALALLVDRTRLDAAGAVTEVADLVLPADRWTVGG